MVNLLTIAMSTFLLKWKWEPGFGTVSGKRAAAVKHDADASSVDALLMQC